MDKMIPIAKLVYNIPNEEQLASMQKGKEEPLANIIKDQVEYVTTQWIAASEIPSKSSYGKCLFGSNDQILCRLLLLTLNHSTITYQILCSLQ